MKPSARDARCVSARNLLPNRASRTHDLGTGELAITVISRGNIQMRDFLSSREVLWTLLGALIGFAYNRMGAAAGST